jgi:Kef-type K+ transport system membrane component KefB
VGNPARQSAFVWSTDLRLGYLPPVCLKTGLPADASVRFRFVTRPNWAYLLLLLVLTGIGLLVVGLIMRVVSRRESGRLPYVRSAAKRIRLCRGVAVVTAVGVPVLLVAAVISLGGDNTVAAMVWSALLVDVVAAIVITQLVLRRIGPNGYIHDSHLPQGRWVELRRVHPAFAAAVAEMYASRWAAVRPLQPAPYGVAFPPPPA